MGPIVTIARKELMLLLRDKFALFWVFAFPLLYAIFFGSIFGDGGDGVRSGVRIAIVDDDQSEGSASLVAKLTEHESLSVERESEEEDAPFRLYSLEDAREAVRKGRRVAYVRIRPGYGDSPFRMFGGGDDDGAAVEIGIDPSRSADTGILQGILMETLFGGMSDMWADKDAMSAEIGKSIDAIDEADDLGGGQKLVLRTFMSALDAFLQNADTSILEGGPGAFGGGGSGGMELVEKVDVTREEQKGPRSAFDVTFPSAIVWGLMGVAVTFAITLVRERTQGTLLRLKIAPMSRAQLLAGKALGCFVTCMIVMAFILAVGWVAMGVRFDSLLFVAMSMVSTAICFTGVMMMSSVMGKTEQAVGGASWGVMMPFAMIGGGMIPLIAMPPWLLKISDLSPFKWGIYSMEGAMWRGFGFTDMLGPCGILVGFGVVFFFIGVRVFHRMDG